MYHPLPGLNPGMCAGNYSFLNGAGLSISGYAPNRTVGGGSGCAGVGPSTFYFEGGSGLTGSGTNGITIYPGVFTYSDRSNTATFEWSGRSNNESEGVVCLPSSPLQMSGASNAKVFTGQMIVDRIITSGNMVLQVDYEEYVSFEIPAVYLVN